MPDGRSFGLLVLVKSSSIGTTVREELVTWSVRNKEALVSPVLEKSWSVL